MVPNRGSYGGGAMLRIVICCLGGATNPVTFPDEPRSMTCGRTTSHRKMLRRKGH